MRHSAGVDAMTYSEADVPLRAPRLLHLSANVVASHSTALLSRKTNEPTAGPSTSPIHLPLPASTAVFNALREEWVRTGVTPTAALEQFTDGSRLPLDSLPLAKAHLSDRLLANLVAAHRSRLTSLDISDAQVWCTASCSCTTFCFTCVSEYNGQFVS
uniref:Uncharacterized protein n=1 Tax=Ascaris lumbricoides TaxID=6252 RepID=A0A0M3IBP5_ASCLU